MVFDENLIPKGKVPQQAQRFNGHNDRAPDQKSVQMDQMDMNQLKICNLSRLAQNACKLAFGYMVTDYLTTCRIYKYRVFYIGI